MHSSLENKNASSYIQCLIGRHLRTRTNHFQLLNNPCPYQPSSNMVRIWNSYRVDQQLYLHNRNISRKKVEGCLRVQRLVQWISVVIGAPNQRCTQRRDGNSTEDVRPLTRFSTIPIQFGISNSPRVVSIKARVGSETPYLLPRNNHFLPRPLIRDSYR